MEGLATWPPVSSLVLRVVCEGCDDPNAATALFEARQAGAASPVPQYQQLQAPGALPQPPSPSPNAPAIAAFGPPPDAPLRIIGQARTRIDRISSGNGFGKSSGSQA